MKSKKLVALLLCLVMLLSAMSVHVFAAEEPLPSDEGLHYVVLGDSIAYGSGLNNPQQAVYGKIVADTNGYVYDNYAIPGYTTDQLLRRLSYESVKKDVEKADIISISIGGNNFLLDNIVSLLYDGIVRKNYARFDEIADGFYEDLGTIIETIRELNPDAAILMQTIYNPQTEYVGEVYQAGADRINAKIKAFAEENPGEIIVVDIASVLTDSDKDFAEDRIHPSAVGNEKIAVAVLQALKENGLGDSTDPVINTKGTDVRFTGGFTRIVNFVGSFLHAIAVVRNFFRIG